MGWLGSLGTQRRRRDTSRISQYFWTIYLNIIRDLMVIEIFDLYLLLSTCQRSRSIRSKRTPKPSSVKLEKNPLSTGSSLPSPVPMWSDPLMNSILLSLSSGTPNIKISFRLVYFSITIVKKLKSLDLPDLLQAVQSKKLPKEALRGVLSRFKL